MSLRIQFEQQSPMFLSGQFTCDKGQLLALVGPSGAGKSSILRVLAGLMKPTQGYIKVGEQVWLNTAQGIFKKPQQRRVGLVFQDYALMPHLSAIDNVVLALGHLEKTDQIPEALRWLERVHLSEDEAKRRPAELSGGQQQRVALARALARSPQLLLLDEPFSSIDQMNRESLYRLLAELRSSLNIPIVMVTHDLNEARMLSDKMAVLDAGKVLQEGPAFDVYRYPCNSRVADLVGIQNRFCGIWQDGSSRDGWGVLKWCSSLNTAKPDSTDAFPLLIRDEGKVPAGSVVNWIIHADGLAVKPHGFSTRRQGYVLLPVKVQTHRDLGELSLFDLVMEVAPFDVFKMALAGSQRLGLKRGELFVLEMKTELIHVMPEKGGSVQTCSM